MESNRSIKSYFLSHRNGMSEALRDMYARHLILNRKRFYLQHAVRKKPIFKVFHTLHQEETSVQGKHW